MARKTTASEPPSSAVVKHSGDSDAWPIDGLTAAWMNLWLTPWTAWLEQLNASSAASQASSDNRRLSGLPWVPRVEATVIPFRRRDDQPGTEAAKLSLRVRLPAFPWADGSASVISIDTLTRRPAGTSGDVPPIRR